MEITCFVCRRNRGLKDLEGLPSLCEIHEQGLHIMMCGHTVDRTKED